MLQRVQRNCVGQNIKGERKVRWDDGMHFIYNMYDIRVKKESSDCMLKRLRHIKQSSTKSTESSIIHSTKCSWYLVWQCLLWTIRKLYSPNIDQVYDTVQIEVFAHQRYVISRNQSLTFFEEARATTFHVATTFALKYNANRTIFEHMYTS